jgi:hypothetical protein
MNLSLGDTVTFNYASGIKSGRIIDIAENINAINLLIYCTDSTGSYKVTVPHYNVIEKNIRGGIMEEIKKPSRYNKRGSLECWDVILDQEMNFLEGNVLKYIWRYKEKNGIEDLKKARVYLDKLILESEKK